MQPLETQSVPCAALVMEVVPLVMRTIRAEMRRHRPVGLSVPHFRTLAFLRNRPGSSLSSVAEHLGLTLPSISRMVDGLVRRGLVSRGISPIDRRRVVLSLTRDGHEVLTRAQQTTRGRLAGMLGQLSGDEREALVRGMEILRAVFAAEGERAGAVRHANEENRR